MKRFFLLVVIFFIYRSIDAQEIGPPVPCVTDQNCSFLAKNQKDPTCKGGFCVCLNEQEKLTNCSSLYVGIKQNKTHGSQFYQTCKRNEECNFNNSFCNTSRSQCECQKDYVPSAEKQECLKVAQGLNFPCVEDKQCLTFQANTICVDQQCICANGYHVVEKLCWKTIPFGSPCTKSEECYHINKALCTDQKVCGCGDKMIIDSSKRNCLPYAETIDDYCRNNDHCSMIQDSVCVNEKCECPKGKHFVNEIKKCITNRNIDEPCQHDYDCYQSENGTSSTSNPLQCMGSLCDCADNYHRQNDTCVSAGVPTSRFSLLIILASIACAFFLQ